MWLESSPRTKFGSMKLGLAIFPTDTTLQPVELGQTAEALGFESIWFPEHSHIPTSRATPRGGRKGATPLPEFYWRSHDQFVALAAIAATTTNLKLATGISLIAQRDPIWTAKEVATLDTISNGRVLFGIGYGWNKEELAHHGVKYTERRAIVRENILAMKALWTDEEASFDGDHVSFSSSWAWPKPVQAGGPPVILGGSAGPKTARDIAEFCDGWMPIGSRHAIEAGMTEIKKACAAIDRDPGEIELGVFFAKPDPDALEALAQSGVKRAVLGLPQGEPAEVVAAMEEFARLL